MLLCKYWSGSPNGRTEFNTVCSERANGYVSECKVLDVHSTRQRYSAMWRSNLLHRACCYVDACPDDRYAERDQKHACTDSLLQRSRESIW